MNWLATQVGPAIEALQKTFDNFSGGMSKMLEHSGGLIKIVEDGMVSLSAQFEKMAEEPVPSDELDDACLDVTLTAAHGCTPVARAPGSGSAHPASRNGCSWAHVAEMKLSDPSRGLSVRRALQDRFGDCTLADGVARLANALLQQSNVGLHGSSVGAAGAKD